MLKLYPRIQKLAKLKPLMVLLSLSILSACETSQIAADLVEGDLKDQGPGDYPLFIAPEGKNLVETNSETGQVVNCFKERFVHPPNKKNRSIGYRFVVKAEWAGKVDWQSLSLNLDQADFDFTTNIDGREVRFTNPGKSRAVIDVEYCTIPHDPQDPSDSGTGGDTSTGGDGSSTGGSTGTGSNDWDPTDDGGIFIEGCQTSVDCGASL